MRAAAALGPRDYLGVVAFDEVARWAVEVRPLVDLITLETSIGSLPALGETNLQAGLETGYAALDQVEARLKHIILLTDGWIREGNLSPLATEKREQGITLSVVAAGQGSARYLEELAVRGGGRFYPAIDILRVPDFFLKETVQAAGRYIVEEPFYPLPGMPSPILRGLDVATTPPLLGYNGTTPKRTARVVLSTPREDPLLATWQYGLGRSVAWTSDLQPRWAVEWLGWDGFGRFVAQWVGWTLPAPQVEGLNAQATVQEEQAVLSAEVADAAGRPRNFLDVTATLIAPDLSVREVELTQVGAGQYEARAALGDPGTYMVRLNVQDGEEALGQQTLGLVLPYSPEYTSASGDAVNRPLLEALARRTGGGELLEPLSAFAHDLPSADRAREAWRGLLLAAALLFPLDVALRRLIIGPRDLQRAWNTASGWIRARLPAGRTAAAPDERALGRLFEARRRGQARTARRDARDTGRAPGTAETPADPSGAAPTSDQDLPGSEGPAEPRSADSLARLREAKRRARRR
jgi:hypothetical protein